MVETFGTGTVCRRPILSAAVAEGVRPAPEPPSSVDLDLRRPIYRQARRLRPHGARRPRRHLGKDRPCSGSARCGEVNNSTTPEEAKLSPGFLFPSLSLLFRRKIGRRFKSARASARTHRRSGAVRMKSLFSSRREPRRHSGGGKPHALPALAVIEVERRLVTVAHFKTPVPDRRSENDLYSVRGSRRGSRRCSTDLFSFFSGLRISSAAAAALTPMARPGQ